MHKTTGVVHCTMEKDAAHPWHKTEKCKCMVCKCTHVICTVEQWDSSTAVFSTNHNGKGSGTHTHLYVALISSAQNSANCCSEQSDTMQRDRSSAKYTELAHIYPLHHRHNHVTRPNTSPDKTAPIPYICNPECCPKSPSPPRRRVFQRVPRFLVLNIL